MSIHYQLHPNSAQLLEAQAHLNILGASLICAIAGFALIGII
ncbi:histone acetyltransferase [Vibrio vulnificus]|nr:histone acetyltransferase [Vibrio vulnificus]